MPDDHPANRPDDRPDSGRAVLDASAILAFLQGDDGAATVEDQLVAGACCPAVNWSEVAQKVLAAGRAWDPARALLLSYGLVVEPVIIDDAELAASRWRHGDGLSLADRLCLAVADRLGAAALTADTAWGTGDNVQQIRS